MAFIKPTQPKDEPKVDFSRLPRHVAIIMDGNGRWAKRRGLPRTAGHAAGAETFRTIRRDAMDKFKAMEKKSEITEDDRKDYEKELQDITEKRCKQIDELTAKKEAELMAV